MHGFPEIEPYDSGMLDVGDGHLVYWETCGNPAGKPALVSTAGLAAVLAGLAEAVRPVRLPHRPLRPARLRPEHAPRQRPGVDLSTNTTPHLIADSSGSESISASTAGSSAARRGDPPWAWPTPRPTPNTSPSWSFQRRHNTRREVEWITRDMGRVFPAEWARFRDGVPAGGPRRRPAMPTPGCSTTDDPAVRDRAANDWCAWEDTHVRAGTGLRAQPALRRPGASAWLRPPRHPLLEQRRLHRGRQLLRDAPWLAGIPGVLIRAGSTSAAPRTSPGSSGGPGPRAGSIWWRRGHGAGSAGMKASLEAAARFARQ